MTEKVRNRTLVLASGSPRREQLLREAGLSFEVDAPPPEEENGVDQALQPKERAQARARAKAAWTANRLP
jgi:predicted house-cleaning NTP pyrophosphatase (Maf/HAM1 superfamily)